RSRCSRPSTTATSRYAASATPVSPRAQPTAGSARAVTAASCARRRSLNSGFRPPSGHLCSGRACRVCFVL
ncbi:hypothetical protein EXIGLDRAFT_671511, partial [Exidia glandulosa HHB12029]